MKILLIAGHGQGDPGACACGYKESVLTREVVSLLKSKLLSVVDVTVFDTSKNMYTCLKTGNSYNFKAFDYVLEVHFNAGVGDARGNNKTTGVEILVHTSESGVSVEQKIVDNIAALGFRNRGVKTRSDLLNMNTCKKKQGVSYALLETCFIDDLDDMKLYQTKKNEYQIYNIKE
jgi:N-acetylmuramoyl-L-alanine amidase